MGTGMRIRNLQGHMHVVVIIYTIGVLSMYVRRKSVCLIEVLSLYKLV